MSVKLTLGDPVSHEVLEKFRELADIEIQLGRRLLDMEREKITIAVTASTAKREKDRLFAEILNERGLPGDFSVELDSETGKLIPLEPEPRAE